MRELNLEVARTGNKLQQRLSDSAGNHFAESQSAVDYGELLELTRPDAQDLGARLAAILLPDPLVAPLADALRRETVRLRVRLSQDLLDLPFEACTLKELGPVALHPHARIFRCGGDREVTANPDEELRVLIATSDPRSRQYGALVSAEPEAQSVFDALASPECGRIEARIHLHATPATLSRELKSARTHVFHFAGHGDIHGSSGVLVLEGAEEHEHALLPAAKLAEMLVGTQTQVAVLGSCGGGATVSVGMELVDRGVPAVVAMQTPIGDASAHLFARALYAALAEGRSLEEAVWQGRMAIRGTGNDWFAPILIAGKPGARPFPKPHARGNLPERLTSYVGRSGVIRRVSELLEDERLVTLLGSGGIGKTSLSIEVGKRVPHRFPQGVWLVALESIAKDEQVVEAIAGVFGIRESETTTVESRLYEFLADQNLLLILDNCEHVIPGAREAVNRILATCPHVQILATSRTVLDASTDCLVRVEPLEFPILPEEEPVKPAVMETLAGYEANELFLQRAGSAHTGFKTDGEGMVTISRIVRRLDGIPLAIELAAARVHMLSLGQILERLNDEFDLLDLGKPGNVPRHKTMRATLEWSYALLQPEKQTFLNRLGAFRGSFSLPAVEQVAGGNEFSPNQCFELLSKLVDNSLVIPAEGEGAMRYHLLETTRQYALGRLGESGETETVLNRHLEWVRTFVKEKFQLAVAGDIGGFLSEIAEVHESALGAIDWALGAGASPTVAGEIVRDLYYFWQAKGRLSFARTMLTRVLSAFPETENALGLILRVLHGAVCVLLGDRSGLAELRAAYELSKDKHEWAQYQAQSWLADGAYLLGEDTLAEEFYRIMLQWAVDHHRTRSEGHARIHLGNLELARGRLEEARALYSQCLRAKEEEGEELGIARSLIHVGYVEMLSGEAGFSHKYRKGIQRLANQGFLAETAQYLPLVSILFLPDRVEDGASLIGLADRLAEEIGVKPERFVVDWAEQARARLQAADPRAYSSGLKLGRTLDLAHLGEILSRVPDSLS